MLPARGDQKGEAFQRHARTGPPRGRITDRAVPLCLSGLIGHMLEWSWLPILLCTVGRRRRRRIGFGKERKTYKHTSSPRAHLVRCLVAFSSCEFQLKYQRVGGLRAGCCRSLPWYMKFEQQMAGTKRAAEAGGKQEVIVRRPADLHEHTWVNMIRLEAESCVLSVEGRRWGLGVGGEGTASSHRSYDVGSPRCPLPLHAFSVRLMA